MTHLLIGMLVLMGWLNSNHFGPWVSWHSEVPLFLLVFVISMHALWRRGASLCLPPSAWLPAGLGLVLLVQYGAGLVIWRGQVLVVMLYFFLTTVCIGWAYHAVRTIPQHSSAASSTGPEWLAWALIVGGVLSVGLALAQVFQQWDGATFIARQIDARRPGANMAQPNHLATLLAMGMGAGLFLHMRRRLELATLNVVTAALGIGIAITESRGGLLAVLAVCAFWAWHRSSESKILTRGWPIWLAIGQLTAFFTWPKLYAFWSSGAIGEGRFMQTGGDPRWVLWRELLDASLMKPWFGWGVRNTAEAHNAVAHTTLGTLPVTYSHNILLDFGIWFGWPLALTIASFAMVWLWRRIAVLRSEPVAWFGMALLVPFGIHSLLEFPFAYAYLLVPAALGIGYVEGVSGSNALNLQPARHCVTSILTGFAVLAIWSAIDYVHAEEDFRDARFQMLRIGPSPVNPPPKILLLDQLGDLLRSMRVPLEPGMAAAQLDLLRKAALHYPWSGSQYRYAVALAFNGEPDESRRQMRVLRAQQGFVAYRPLALQLELNLAQRALPPLGLTLE